MKAGRLKIITLNFEMFPDIHQVHAMWITEAQGAATLSAENKTIILR